MASAGDLCTGLEATDVLSTKCTLTWKVPSNLSSDATQLRLEFRLEGSDGEWSAVVLPTSQTSHTVEALLPATIYRFRIRVILSSGPATDATTPLRVETPIGLPQPPKNFAISRRTPNSLTLSWRPGHDGGKAVEAYEIQYHSLGPSFSEWSKAQVKRSPIIIKSLVEHARYEVRVRSRTAFGWSEPCSPCEASLDDHCAIPTPAAPTALAVTETVGALKLDVQAGCAAEGLVFLLFSKTSSASDWVSLKARTMPHKGGPTFCLSVDRSALDNGDENHLMVRARNECGLGPASNILTYVSTPKEPTLRVKKIGHSSTVLEWTENASPHTEYELSMLREGAREWTVLKTDLKRAICIKRNLDAKTSYTFRIRTHVRDRWSPYSNLLTVTTKSLDEVLTRLREKVHSSFASQHVLQPQMFFFHRHMVLDQSIEALSRIPIPMWACDFFISFAGEEGSDYGALHREWLRMFIDQLAHPDRALFTHIQHGLAQPSHLHHHQDGSLALFRLLGLALARALLRDCRVATRFSPIVYKYFLGQSASLDDLSAIDPELHRNLEWLRANDVSSLGLTFAHEVKEFDVVKTVALLPGGEGMPVTNQNKEEFIKLRCHAHLASLIEEPLKAMQQGFQTLIPTTLSSDLSVADLQLALCGSSVLSVHEWKRATLLTDNMRAFPQTIKDFWDIVAEMTPQQRTQLLAFTTASAALPPGGFSSLNPKFTLEAMMNGPPGALPVAHACFCVLELPVWHDYETQRSKLLMAISETSGYGIV
eukprot:m.12124 g.12124  ORF g.12124 m.12124 type:complete len:765 (+) comp5958_c0_seq1:129-2423(+)